MAFEIGAVRSVYSNVSIIFHGSPNDKVHAYWRSSGLWQGLGCEFFGKDLSMWKCKPLSEERSIRVKVKLNDSVVETTVGAALAIGIPRKQAPKRHRLEESNTEMVKRMWKSRRWTDAVVCCGERTFEVHRAVLGARSDVFAAMFSQEGLQEGASQRVCFEHVASDVVEALIEYCYTGAIVDSCDCTALLQLAHQYEMDDLIGACCERLLDQWSPATASESLVAIFPLREHLRIRALWKEIIDRVLKAPNTFEGILESVLGSIADSKHRKLASPHQA